MIKNWDAFVDPNSPHFITNSLKNPIKTPIILYNKSLSDIIDGQ